MGDQELKDYFIDSLKELLGPEEIMILITSFVVLIVYFVLAYYSTRLARKTSIPGARIIAWSCWIIAFSWFPLLIFRWNEDLADVMWFIIVTDTIFTLAIVAGGYGFRKLVIALLKKNPEQVV